MESKAQGSSHSVKDFLQIKEAYWIQTGSWVLWTDLALQSISAILWQGLQMHKQLTPSKELPPQIKTKKNGAFILTHPPHSPTTFAYGSL